jgi:hypothetical protein
MMARFWTIGFCVYFLCLIGCQRLPSRPEGMPDLVPCTVAVTFGGEKVDKVGIVLQPKNKAENNWSASGQTDAEGKAVLKTAAYYEGVAPGEYTISFQKYAPPEDMGPGTPLIPLQYSPGMSEETITVSSSQAEYVFELEAL